MKTRRWISLAVKFNFVFLFLKMKRAGTLANTIKRPKKGAPAAPSKGPKNGDFVTELSGDTAIDGLHRYEVDLFETEKWTSKMITEMEKMKSTLKPLPFIEPKKTICIVSSKTYTSDCCKPPIPEYHKDVTMFCNVLDLQLNDKEMHAFLLLAGNTYDPISKTIKWTINGKKSGYSGDGLVKKLQECLEDTIKTAKQEADEFYQVAIKFKKGKDPARLEFPVEWLPAAGKEEEARAM